MNESVTGQAWISSSDTEEYWAEGIKCSVEVETTDADEVRIGFVLDGEDTEAAGVYLSRLNADCLARFLSAASVAEVRVPSA